MPAEDTRRRILDVARGMFNARGLHRVGVRDIARELGISPGNLSYHFPTKDDLVAALMTELRELNSAQVFSVLPADLSLVTFYRAAVAVMRNTLPYRFVLLSYVDAVTASPELQRFEHSLQGMRRKRMEDMVALLAKNGYIDARAFNPRAHWVHEQGEMISSGWLRHAALRPDRRDDAANVLHYAKVGAALLEPYCTPKGARQMREILAGEHDH